jgi:hypothetical protein
MPAMPDLLDTFGRVCMAEFIGSLVQELPALPDGAPALTLFPAVFYRGADAVPVGYGRVLAKKVWRILRRQFWNREIIEEAMLTFVTTATRKKVYLSPGCEFRLAQRYVIKSALNAARNVVRTRRRKRRGEVPLEPEPDDDGPRRELADPVSLDEQDRLAFEVQVRLALGDENRLDRFSYPVPLGGSPSYSRREIRRALEG